MQDEYDLFVARVRSGTSARLATWLHARVAEAQRRGADVEVVADAVLQLALRGGKRMRPVLLVAAYEGCEGQGSVDALLPAPDDLLDRTRVRRVDARSRNCKD